MFCNYSFNLLCNLSIILYGMFLLVNGKEVNKWVHPSLKKNRIGIMGDQ